VARHPALHGVSAREADASLELNMKSGGIVRTQNEGEVRLHSWELERESA
jgi:hypothetical protein